MTSTTDRTHLDIAGASPRELGRSRGRALASTLADAYARYSELFRALGVTAEMEEAGVERALAAVEAWRPAIVEQLAGVAEGAGVPLAQIVALNARTELIALGRLPGSECSTVASLIDGRRFGVQTWDWHIELDAFWHTQTVAGPGYRFVGLTEQGILAKIGLNEAGLMLHFNILGHADDGADGIPMHLLSYAVLTECATVDEAIALVRETPIGSSSAFTMLDAQRAVSLEISPAGIFVIDEADGSVQRTNHFQDDRPLAGQKSEHYEPDSSRRLELLRARLAERAPASTSDMVDLLVSGEGEPPLTCVPNMEDPYGERWATLATVVSDPQARTLSVLDGMPTEAATGAWRTLVA